MDWPIEGAPINNKIVSVKQSRIFTSPQFFQRLHALNSCYDSCMRSDRQFLGIYITSTVGLRLSAYSAQSRAALTRKDPPYPADKLHSGPAWFIDVAESAGLRMKNVNGGANTKKYIIETTGSGLAIFDYDNDRWPDIFLVNGTTLDAERGKGPPTSHLFHNNHDGTFSDVTRAAGPSFSGWGSRRLRGRL